MKAILFAGRMKENYAQFIERAPTLLLVHELFDIKKILRHLDLPKAWHCLLAGL